VKSRLDREQSLSFLEFNYMILQAYDFLELNRRYGCLLQMGGSDQWGNIVNGIDLTRRVLDHEIYGLTSPLLTTSDGKKMGKSQSGAVWLNADMLSPYEFWQFWRNTTDADVGRFLKLYTELPLDECDRLGRAGGLRDQRRQDRARERGHRRSATGARRPRPAEATAREVFEKGGVGDDLPTLALSAERSATASRRAAHRALGPCEIGQGGQAPDRRQRRRMNDAPLTDAGLMIAAAITSPPAIPPSRPATVAARTSGPATLNNR
jgi:tyrosyl-tRNA synthetase